MIEVRRAADRFRTDQPGITTRHSFSSGAHYDPDNVSFGAVLACDEHVLEPGAGFEQHRHARVELVSWVLEGELRHEDATGRARTVAPGDVQYQRAGSGIEHAERNASSTVALRFVQLWLADDADAPDYAAGRPPRRLDAGAFEVWHEGAPLRSAAHLFVASGHFTVAGYDLTAGDSARVRTAASTISGRGELLVVLLSKA